MILALLWFSQPSHLRHLDIPSIIAIVFCIKAVYYIDHDEGARNAFKTDAAVKDLKLFVSDHYYFVSFLPLIAMFILDN